MDFLRLRVNRSGCHDKRNCPD